MAITRSSPSSFDPGKAKEKMATKQEEDNSKRVGRVWRGTRKKKETMIENGVNAAVREAKASDTVVFIVSIPTHYQTLHSKRIE